MADNSINIITEQNTVVVVEPSNGNITIVQYENPNSIISPTEEVISTTVVQASTSPWIFSHPKLPVGVPQQRWLDPVYPSRR